MPATNVSPELSHWQSIQELMRGYRIAQVLITCTRFGLFDLLEDKPLTAAELAKQAGVSCPALVRLLNAAVAHGFLRKEGDAYANGPIAESCLTQDSPFRISNLIRREHAFYQRWSWLDEAVRSGERPDASIRDEAQRDWVWDFEMALYDTARIYGPLAAAALDLPPDRPLRVLDVGGGHGGYSMALADHYPNVEATVYELPAAAAVAREIIEREGMSARIAVQEGNFQEEGLDGDYDLVLLFGVLVSETPAGKRDLLRKSHAALKPAGQLVIRGSWLDENRAGPPEATLFSLHMLLSTEAGDLSTRAEIDGYLTECGFLKAAEIKLPHGGSLLVTQKTEG